MICDDVAEPSIRVYLNPEKKLRFKTACASQGRDMSDVCNELIDKWLEENEASIKPQRRNYRTIALLVQDNYFKLLSNGRIKADILKAIAEGDRPSADDLAKIAHILGYPEEELVAMRDRHD